MKVLDLMILKLKKYDWHVMRGSVKPWLEHGCPGEAPQESVAYRIVDQTELDQHIFGRDAVTWHMGATHLTQVGRRFLPFYNHKIADSYYKAGFSYDELLLHQDKGEMYGCGEHSSKGPRKVPILLPNETAEDRGRLSSFPILDHAAHIQHVLRVNHKN